MLTPFVFVAGIDIRVKHYYKEHTMLYDDKKHNERFNLSVIYSCKVYGLTNVWLH